MKIAIIGGGVIGALTARELTRYACDVVLIERGADVAEGASRANSGIVHAGHDAPEGSLKARFNVEGNALMPAVCKELGVKYRNNGSIVAAYSDADMPAIERLYARGVKNGVTGLEIRSGAELKSLEPNLADSCVGGLLAKTGGIVCPYGLTIAAAGNAMDNGARLLTSFEVRGIRRENGFVLEAADGREERADYVVNCAGIQADTVAGLLGDRSFTIGARKGQYLLLDGEYGSFVDHTLFSCPTKAGKGVLISPTVDGNIIIGPTAEETADREDTATTAEGLRAVVEKARGMCENVPFGGVITSFVGMRAYSDRNDFIVSKSPTEEGLYHIAGIESPGLTSAPAIARYAANEIRDICGLGANAGFDPFRTPESFFKEMGTREKNAYIQAHPEYGRIVCRCEGVTLGELLHAARANPPARTIGGLKRRTRAGMGRCQGGFCQPSVTQLLMDTFGLKETEVTLDGGQSFILTGETK